MRSAAFLLIPLLAGACAPAAPRQPAEGQPAGFALPPDLPDSAGRGTHVLALERSPASGLWVGTYGDGIYRLAAGREAWTHIVASDSQSISWDFVNSIAFGRDSVVWYGTVGNGWGVSTDAGRTWRNWGYDELGPEWQYVAHDGIRARGDTVYIATADGLRISFDQGATWRCVTAAQPVAGGSEPRPNGCGETIAGLPNEYLLALDVDARGAIWAGHLGGLAVSRDLGRTWSAIGPQQGIPAARIRAVVMSSDSSMWVADENGVFVDSLDDGMDAFVPADIRVPGSDALPGKVRGLFLSPAPMKPAIATSFGMAASTNDQPFRLYYLAAGDHYRPAADVWSVVWWGPPYWPLGGTATGLTRVLAGESPVPMLVTSERAAPPAASRRPWLGRPIADAEGNPYIDATYRYGSTMGGNFQQHQGVEFNNPAGTPVRSIADGTVVFAGAAEAGANTVAIRHDARDGDRYVYSVYYHNSSLDVRNGEQVTRGQVIARVGNTGRATNDHLHLEVHNTTSSDSSAIVNPAERFPAHTVNPQLYVEPLPGTGVVAGRVLDAAGQPVQGARIYGLVQPFPEETPLSFVETYRERAHPDPLYGENFAIGDIPAGNYLIGAEIGQARVWRRITVRAGDVTWVEFKPTERD